MRKRVHHTFRVDRVGTDPHVEVTGGSRDPVHLEGVRTDDEKRHTGSNQRFEKLPEIVRHSS